MIRTLALPEQGLQVVVDPVSGRVFVRGANPQGPTQEGVLWVVDPSGSTVIATVAEGYGLGDLVPDPAGAVYAVRYTSVGVGELIAIAPDGTTTRDQALARTPSGALAYDPLGDDLLVGFIGGGADIQRFAAATFAPGATGAVALINREPEHLRIVRARAPLRPARVSVPPGDRSEHPHGHLREGPRLRAVRLQRGPLRRGDLCVGRAGTEPGRELRGDVRRVHRRAPSQRPLGHRPEGFGVRPGGGVAITSRSEVSQVVQGDCAPSDDVAPTVSVSAPAEGAEVALYSQHTVVATCADGGSGLAGLNLHDRWASRCLTESDGVPSEAGASLDTSSPGTKSITVRARDNEASVTRHYTVVVPPDETAPAITIITPLVPEPWPGYGQAYDVPGPQPFTLDQQVMLDVSCDDGAYESGVAACDASVHGVPVQNGDPLPTDTPGLKTVHVVTRDVAGNVASLDRQYRVLAGERSESSVGGPQLLTTDPGGLGATARVPVQTDVLLTKFAGGPFDIQNAASQTPPAGLDALSGAPALRIRFPGRNVNPAFFSRVRFRLDSSILPADTGRVLLVRNGAVVAPCTTPSSLSPDPCVRARTIGPDGDLTIETVMLAGDEPSPIGGDHVTYDAVWSFALAAPDLTAPEISLASPAENTVLAQGGVLALDVSCADEAGGSGLASCTTTVDGGTLVEGDPLPATVGSHQVHVVGRDNAGNEATLDRAYVVPAGSISATGITGPATVSTGATATPQEPLQTEVGIPAGVSGSVSVLPTAGGAPPAGYALLPGSPTLTIEAPAASVAAPLRLSFTLDASLLVGPPAIPATSIVPTRDGVAVADCTAPTSATPDPCVESRTTDGQGDVQIVVRTSHASRWSFVRRVSAPPPVEGTSIADARLTEGDTGTNAMTFTLRRTGSPAQPATLRWDTVNGTALAGQDYVAQANKTVRFAARSATATVTVPIVGDRIDESDETFLVRLSNPAGTAIVDGEAIGTIVDEDPPSLSVDDATRLEGDSGTRDLTFTVRLSRKWNRAVSVSWAAQDITTTAGSDYLNGAGQASGRVTIPADARTATITLRVKGDRTREGVAERPGGPRYERLRIVLSQPTQAEIVDPEAIGRIQDDD